MKKDLKIEIAKQISTQYPQELGFVNRAALEISNAKGELEVIRKSGFAHFHHRQDGQTTIYSLAVSRRFQRQGWGRLLFYRVLCSAIEQGQSSVFLKCPVDALSNGFYARLGFNLERVEPGKKRALNCWRYPISTPLLFYCACGGASPFGQIAQEVGWFLGYRTQAESFNNHVAMLDNQFDDYNHQIHFRETMRHKPLLATALDITSPEQLPEIIRQAKAIASYCGRVVLIPKCKVNLPKDFPYWLGFSVPTSHGGTSLFPDFFKDKPVHLLGGTPNQQVFYSKLLNVVSLDSNSAMKIAIRFGKTIYPGTSGKRIVSGVYPIFRLSLKYQKEYWHKTENPWAELPLFQKFHF